MTRSREPALPPAGGLAAWIALVSASSVLFSLTLACATPFAALATVSGLGMRRGQALALMGMAWAANQAVGYGLLGVAERAAAEHIVRFGSGELDRTAGGPAEHDIACAGAVAV